MIKQKLEKIISNLEETVIKYRSRADSFAGLYRELRDNPEEFFKKTKFSSVKDPETIKVLRIAVMEKYALVSHDLREQARMTSYAIADLKRLLEGIDETQ